jgi:hypothetical protein
MPSYEYRCEDNGRLVEVNHRMSEKLHTGGGVCELAGIDPGDTPSDSSVERLTNGGQVVSSKSLRNPEAPPCSMGGCGGGMCRFQ